MLKHNGLLLKDHPDPKKTYLPSTEIVLAEWFEKFKDALITYNYGQWLICLEMDHIHEIRKRFDLSPHEALSTAQILQYFVETEILGVE